MSVGVPAPRNTASWGMPANKTPARPLPTPSGPNAQTVNLSDVIAKLDEEQPNCGEKAKPRSFFKRLFGRR